jgi:xanthine dehydrogenase YagT iron-sulfur-binding subunit
MLAEARRGWPSHVSPDVGRGIIGPAELDPTEVAERMSGNLCRCGAYRGIVDAVLEAAEAPARDPFPELAGS